MGEARGRARRGRRRGPRGKKERPEGRRGGEEGVGRREKEGARRVTGGGGGTGDGDGNPLTEVPESLQFTPDPVQARHSDGHGLVTSLRWGLTLLTSETLSRNY